MKICYSCQTSKPETEFYKSKSTKDGLQGLNKRKPDDNVSAAIRADQRCVDLIKSATKISPRKYVLPDGSRVNLRKELAKLGYVTSSANLTAILYGIRGELTPAQKRRQDASEDAKATKIAKTQKDAPNGGSDTAELIVDIPGIWEIQNRGRGYTSYNFTSLIDDSTFSFPTFREARAARQSMMDAFRQQAIYSATHRQSKAGRYAASEDVSDEVEDDDDV